ncbi:signal transduction superfamily protein with modified HD-GYP domain [Alishewanella longhuensis]|uniref:Signal transduction superfamily protein with modified HD-GYP domain n=1 Tax=Alishewanella longhuensis TaxID=1091037 RepID=A0ABQ3KW98_9ALTE|nr:HDOD domain-containing protein [Alishewanella longhuensis]GHG65352.1 signal transduction superfamily protein with modified HD-GYP domain [Alishewanella longhuensis]
MSSQQALLTILDDKIRQDRLVLPTLPEIALRVRQTADDPKVSLAQMGEVIAQDAALSARMMKVANSAFMGRSIKVSTLNQAVTRIGLSQIKNIATAMALEQLFVSEYKQVQQQLDRLWRDNIQVAAIAVACLKSYQANQPQCRLSPDIMTLCALVHNIGALAVITEAERHPEVFGHPLFLTSVIDKAAPYISVKVLKAWGFAEEFQLAAKSWRVCKASVPLDYTDFIRLAAIARGYYKSAEEQQLLLQQYIERDVVAVPEFMQQPQIASLYQDIRALFQ